MRARVVLLVVGWEPERAPGNPRLARSRALTGHNAHKRDGTSTRVATFIIAAGKVTDPHYPRHREIKFLDLTNQTAAVEREHEIQGFSRQFLLTLSTCRHRYPIRNSNVYLQVTPNRAD